jgi:hypothetical protein
MLVMVTAAVLRLWRLGQLPPGLYRDEAFNGLDALHVLEGQYALFFQANNGREPAYIYLTALFVSVFGRSAMAVRLAAAVTGTLTTWLTYRLATAWFGRLTGILAAGVWAINVWPVHLSRIGLRPILLAPSLALTFWLGTLAYRRQQRWLWLLAGLAYGAAFYTYVAARFTPLLLLSLAAYLVTRGYGRRLWPGALWFSLGAAVTLAPLIYLAWQQPDLVLGRVSQVSVFNTAVNDGRLGSTLWRHLGRAIGLFFWRGDTIWRHNPAGRPVFDTFMTFPFLIGVGWSLRHWRQRPAMLLLLWMGIMLGPTILAEDTPHFLRAAGLLPAVTVLPAVGLARLWTWSRLAPFVRRPLVILLLLASLGMTVRDYVAYGRRPQVAYAFEEAAAAMARQINAEAPVSAVFMDRRFWEGWPSIPFLVTEPPDTLFRPEDGISQRPLPPAAIYVWPFGPLDFVPRTLTPPALIAVETGGLARGDLEDTAYPLYLRYTSQAPPEVWPRRVSFDRQLQLRQATMALLEADRLQVDLFWEAETIVRQDLIAFVHVIGPAGLIAQDDAPPAQGYWPPVWWQPGLVIHDRHVVTLPAAYDDSRHQVRVGLYTTDTGTRLPVLDANGEPVNDVWILQP